MFSLPPGHIHRDQLIPALANLPPHIFLVQLNPHCGKRLLPSLSVQPVALHQRSIDIAQQRLNHRVSCVLRCHPATHTHYTVYDGPSNPHQPLRHPRRPSPSTSPTPAWPAPPSLHPPARPSSTCRARTLPKWHPTGHEPVLFLSERSLFTPGKAIRGGIPIIFPWFGNRTATPDSPRTDGPSHGFARTADWTLAFAALSGDDLTLTLTLGPSETSRALGFDHFQLAYHLTLGAELSLQLTVANLGDTPLHFEEALHSYFSVGDATQISIIGLSDTNYIDKTDDFTRKRQSQAPLTLTGETDRPYLDTLVPVTLLDPVFHRRITVDKANSRTTVVWNPWSELAAKLPDMTPTNWQAMACIETANAADNALTLGPKAAPQYACPHPRQHHSRHDHHHSAPHESRPPHPRLRIPPPP